MPSMYLIWLTTATKMNPNHNWTIVGKIYSSLADFTALSNDFVDGPSTSIAGYQYCAIFNKCSSWSSISYCKHQTKIFSIFSEVIIHGGIVSLFLQFWVVYTSCMMPDCKSTRFHSICLFWYF